MGFNRYLITFMMLFFCLQCSKRRTTNHNATNTPGVQLAPSVPISTPPPALPAPPILATTAQGQINITSPAALHMLPMMNANFAGLSYEKSNLHTALFDANNTTLVALFLKLGPSMLRIGGSSVSKNIWNPSGVGLEDNTTAPADVQRLADFLTATKWQVIYGLNAIPATSTYALSAQEAQYAQQILGDKLAYFEIGNEPNEYADNNFEPATYNIKDFLVDWWGYHDAIKALIPEAIFLGPSSGGDVIKYAVPFAKAVNNNIALLTQHIYCGQGRDPKSTMDFLLNAADANIPALISLLVNTAVENNISQGLRITETNSFSQGGAANVSNAFGAALWLISYSFTLAQYGAIGADFHGGGNANYTPIVNDTNGKILGVGPDYYGILALSTMLPGHLLQTTVSGNANALLAYATLKTDNHMAIVLLNKSSTEIVHASVALPSSFSKAEAMLLTAANLNATTGFTLGGAGINNDGAWSPITVYGPNITQASVEIDVPSGSAYLIDLSP